MSTSARPMWTSVGPVTVVLAIDGTVGLVEHVHGERWRAAEWARASELNRAQLLPP